MNPNRIILLTLALATLLPLTTLAQGWRGGRGQLSSCNQALYDRLDSLAVTALSSDEEAALVHMREEEKLARDVYTTLADSWTLPVFTNIAAAEQRHMELMAVLLDRYGTADPIVDDTVGAFTDPELAELYTSLVAAGQSSLEQALIVGATIEDLDLADLGRLIEETDNPDIRLIANNLAKGSRNHLRAFTRLLGASGYGLYTAQYLSQDQVDEIVAASQERGVVYDENGATLTSFGGGCGKGNGWGCGQGGRCGRQGNGQGGGLRDGSCIGAGQGGGPRNGSCTGAGQGGGPRNGSCMGTGS
jgi:hypothetical protein